MTDRLVASSVKDSTYYIHQEYSSIKTDTINFEWGLIW